MVSRGRRGTVRGGALSSRVIPRAKKLATYLDRNFIELGEQLVQLRDSCDDHKEFLSTIQKAGISYRRARYHISIFEKAALLRIPTADLLAVGWTKAGLIAPVLTGNDWQVWIARAKDANTLTLVEMVKTGGKAERNAARKALVLPVKDSTHRAFYKALRQLGARKSAKARQWENLDVVLMRMVRAVREQSWT